MKDCEFAILGAGALGSVIGAHLARAGHRVIMLARGPRARAIEEQGLRIKGLRDFSQRVAVLTDPGRLETAEVFVVATKTTGSPEALEPYRHARIGAAFSVQNGVIKDDRLAGVWGRQRVLGALADTSAELCAGGDVLFTRNERIYLGELDGGSNVRAERIAGLIDASGVRSCAVANIESLEWSKFAAWVALMALSVSSRAVTWKYMVDPDLARLLARLVREVGTLAAAREIPLSDQSPLPVATIARSPEAEGAAMIQALGRELKNKAPEHRMSSLHDIEAGRALELADTITYAVRGAAALNLAVPTLELFHRLVVGIDRVKRM